MLIKTPTASTPSPSEITPETIFDQRRKFLSTAAIFGATSAVTATVPSMLSSLGNGAAMAAGVNLSPNLGPITQSKWNLASLKEEATPYEDVTEYNNFYEFGTGKGGPSDNAHKLKTEPWTITVDGAVENPGTYDIETLIKPSQLEDRVYRMRCVEAWSMVIPWVGVPLADVVKRLGPTGKAKYIAFETKNIDSAPSVLNWPYREGLRLDEALNSMPLLTVGLYGKALPNQNGAPIRLVVPWKYGFKSIKSITRISFVEEEPFTSWNDAAASEYGFYSNVNPNVDHRRWTQSKERRIGEFLKRETLMYNGYAEEVASLYDGMDLKKYY